VFLDESMRFQKCPIFSQKSDKAKAEAEVKAEAKEPDLVWLF
jgi:hypothetical protein